MTYSAKKDSRHITLRPDAIAIYDRWRKEGSAIVNTSQAIIEYDNKSLEALQTRLEELEKKVNNIIDRMDGVIP